MEWEEKSNSGNLWTKDMFDCIPSGVVGGGRPQETNLKLVLSRFVFYSDMGKQF